MPEITTLATTLFDSYGLYIILGMLISTVLLVYLWSLRSTIFGMIYMKTSAMYLRRMISKEEFYDTILPETHMDKGIRRNFERDELLDLLNTSRPWRIRFSRFTTPIAIILYTILITLGVFYVSLFVVPPIIASIITLLTILVFWILAVKLSSNFTRQPPIIFSWSVGIALYLLSTAILLLTIVAALSF